jgi:hypothetical protein
MIRLPTTDLYLRNACAQWIQPWWQFGRASAARPIRQIAANGFTCGEWMVLIRRDSPAVMRAALDWPGRLAYVIDDDIAGAADSADLPAAYRQRLAEFHSDWHRHLLARANVLLVPSDPLAARLAKDPHIGATIRRIEPHWPEPFAHQSHFAELARGEPLRIAHLGSGSHRAGLAALAPGLTKLLARHSSVELTYIAAPPVIAELAAQPRARCEPPRRWLAYRRWLPRQRFHLALYPLLPTAFDRARSANKLLEHAIVGAVGLYPDNWQPALELAQAQPGGTPGALLAPADAADWADALEAAIVARTELAAIAATATRILSARRICAMQQSLWSDVLGLTIPCEKFSGRSMSSASGVIMP